ncbi:MAG: glycosyltransferase family 2 protein [candidate division WWE3 bacterium]|nr:glycosyltransferase family 2 protein [candidate division WWE3 bacterium]
MSKLSICIPVYNEQATIRELLDKVTAVPLDKEIIVVNDGSTDRTPQILAEYADNHHISVFNKSNGGKGTALIEAFKHVSGDYVVVQDADLEYDPFDFVKMLATAESKNVTVVYGSRFLGKPLTMSVLKNYLASKLLSFFVWLLYGQMITDESTCYKLFKTEVLKQIPLECKRFEFCPEVTAKVLKRGIKIIEVPVSFNPRDAKDGKKISYLKDGWEAVATLFKYSSQFKSRGIS